jgi:hypothetical protein
MGTDAKVQTLQVVERPNLTTQKTECSPVKKETVDLSFPSIFLVLLAIYAFRIGNKTIKKKDGKFFGYVCFLFFGMLALAVVFISVSLLHTKFIIESDKLSTFLGTMGDFISPFAMVTAFATFIIEKFDKEKESEFEKYEGIYRKQVKWIEKRLNMGLVASSEHFLFSKLNEYVGKGSVDGIKTFYFYTTVNTNVIADDLTSSFTYFFSVQKLLETQIWNKVISAIKGSESIRHEIYADALMLNTIVVEYDFILQEFLDHSYEEGYTVDEKLREVRDGVKRIQSVVKNIESILIKVLDEPKN